MAGERSDRPLILGAGMTGLAAARASGNPVLEAAPDPGGICSSYYVRPGAGIPLPRKPEDGEVYRFEKGGGHWIFGGDPMVLSWIESLSPTKRYTRRSAVYFAKNAVTVPYPLQDNLRFLDPAVSSKVLQEIGAPAESRPDSRRGTMRHWLRDGFGDTLCDLFFDPFHERYTGGLYRRIAPQDAYKTPIDPAKVREGARAETTSSGYNVSFAYPCEGLDVLARRMAEGCDVRYGCRVVSVDTHRKRVNLADGQQLGYRRLMSTLPLNKTLRLAGLRTEAPGDPYTSVLVLNIGARRGPRCPVDHWVYVPDADAGFHRVGFYSNIDADFLPAPADGSRDRVSLYVEKAFPGGARPGRAAVDACANETVAELRRWGWIEETDVVHPTWIDVAYTWRHPGSSWKDEALRILEERDISMIGRYARWSFQGIADSVRDGLFAGGVLSASYNHGNGRLPRL